MIIIDKSGYSSILRSPKLKDNQFTMTWNCQKAVNRHIGEAATRWRCQVLLKQIHWLGYESTNPLITCFFMNVKPVMADTWYILGITQGESI